jgi:hypothetical protein
MCAGERGGTVEVVWIVLSGWVGLNALVVLAALGRATYRARRIRRQALERPGPRPAPLAPPRGSALGR